MNHHDVPSPPAPSYRRQGDLLLLSGQIGVDEHWRPVGGTFQDEAGKAFDNVRKVLSDAGAQTHHILKVTAYLADMNDFDAYNEVWLAEFPRTRPARTTIGATLYPPLRIELDVIAWVDGAVRGPAGA
ncbi:RidA family protein [Nonomuraea typhae]|uniref:RidA family protein n=1 Tax=Nonomuraea typhae TaxID=2603600 RepID=UPI0012FB8D0D|nr:RidA family protein [Nonomuraea typhae]